MRRLVNHRRAAAAMLCAIVCGLAGCRHADVNRELVEREMRLQEDEIYRAHDLIASREQQLESVRRENDVLKRELAQARSGTGIPPDVIPQMPPAPTGEPPGRTPRPRSGVLPNDIQPPTIEIPGQQPPGGGTAPSRWWLKGLGVAPAAHEAPVEGEPDARAAGELYPAVRTANRVAKIMLDRRLTGGFDADGRLGDEGIVVVVEPRDQSGRIVRASGKISVAVIDPALRGEAGRVARWDFDDEEVHHLFREGPPADGIRLELRWPGRVPEHERLMVFVRFTAADGERHEASQSILVDLAQDAHTADAQADESQSNQIPSKSGAAPRVGWSPER